MSAKENDDDGDAGGIGGEDVRTAANDTALHVLKGAIVKALGPRAAVTAGVRFSTAWKATLTVEYSSGGKPSEEEIAAIQAAATAFVAADLPVKEFKMEKAAAEAKYKAAPVNHTYVYDKFPVKAGLTELSVVEIDGCNVNACQGPHLKRTGELKGVFLQKQKYRKARNQHEFAFVCGDAAVAGLAEKAAAEAKVAAAAKNKMAAGKAAGTAAGTAAPAAAAAPASAAGAAGDAKPKGGKEKGKDKGDKKADAHAQGKGDAKSAAGAGAGTGAPAVAAPGAGSKPTALEVAAKEVVDQTLRTVTAAVASDPAAVAKVEALRAALHEQVKASLCSFQSASYQAGYASRVVERQHNIQDRL